MKATASDGTNARSRPVALRPARGNGSVLLLEAAAPDRAAEALSHTRRRSYLANRRGDIAAANEIADAMEYEFTADGNALVLSTLDAERHSEGVVLSVSSGDLI